METMTKAQLTEYLGTTLDIDSNEFWDNESSQIYYWDRDLETVKEYTDEYPEVTFEFIHLVDEDHDDYLALWI